MSLIPKFIKKLMNSNKRIRITKVTTISESKKKVILENDVGDHFEFSYNGKFWKWYSTKHIVDKDLGTKLTKAYNRWLKKTNKVSKG